MSENTYEGTTEFVPEVVKGQIVPIEEIPNAVCNCIQNLSHLEQRVKNAHSRAFEAKDKAGSAANVKLAWWKIGDKTKAIESLQDAMVGMSKAQIDQSDAMKAMLEYQRAISKAMRFILALGIGNLSANRAVYKSVEMQMRGASEEELGEMARQELKNTLAQLKSQQDILEQQERTKNVVNRHQKSIQDINKLDEEQEKELERQRGKDEEHDARLDEHIKMIHALEDEIIKLKGNDPGKGERILQTSDIVIHNDNATMQTGFDGCKRWIRSSDERILAGVCAGIARRIDFNIWGMRVLFVFSGLLLPLIPAIIYIVLFFIMNPAPTKKEMGNKTYSGEEVS